ncbi:MAG: dihydroxyacetone kinase subunit L [Nitrosomonadales bacterium]|jgi:dihydroxyacetone kinase-like protein|nr:dihydroxyacetone kinase subunit L [Nitrosomonadales bacterium]MBT3918367.1 dihydroxyacetone kinase subunit L [Nitrosomonadales bacterium]MBT4183498.1 dihydroxyacetone kinase subunit L [Nitrosomonadales bacterium]MBT4571017.1 dihydroxyacetone kinase subunit L [Nitrosomonadales bacterium]MBT4759768.1 dihydroxyacetone kinase subunit L [Nitrosomonadales bacterium]
MKSDFIIQCIDNITNCIVESESEIESLDRVIGDGDHYINIKRGALAVQSIKGDLNHLTNAEAFKKIGMTIMSSVGGASGPLFASFFLALSKEVSDNDDLHKFSLGFSRGVESIMQRGKSKLGDKTMLDVLIPVSEKLQSLVKDGCEKNIMIKEIDLTAQAGVIATKDLIPAKGRSAGLAERAVGHIDPGAKTCQIIISTICNQLNKG